MWNSQVVPPQRPTNSFYQGPPASWEELLEPGHIEHHLGRLNIHDRMQNGRHDVPIPPVPAPMPPLHVLSRVPPPPLNVPVPVRMHQQYLNNYGRVRVTPPVVMNRPPPPLIDTSVPPPSFPAFQPRPSYHTRPQTNIKPTIKGPLTNADNSFPFKSAPVVKIVGEDEHRTQYTPPGPKVKILKRPSSTPSNLSAQGNCDAAARNGPLAKDLKEREEEYARARLRILGSTGLEDKTNPVEEDKTKCAEL